MIGQRLGPYEIEAEIGRGGMGYVYRAVQPSLGRTVAVKTLLPHLVADDEFVERFLREARATARLSHPGIVTIHDVGEQDGVYYFAMEFLSGQTLDDIVKATGPLSTDRAVHYVSQIASALRHAHSVGILHRDVKPSNVLVDDTDRAVLTDFGIAFAVSDSRLTRTGTAVGSPDYMAPEQVEGGQQDQRSDLYALGVLFYQLLTGETPYSGETPMAVAYQHVNGPVRSPRAINPGVPVHIDAIVCRLLAKKPDQRYASADDLLAALGVPTVTGSSTATTNPEAPTMAIPATARQRPPMVAWMAVLLAVVGASLAYGAYQYFGSSGPGRVPSQGGGVVAAPPPAAAAGVGTTPAPGDVAAPGSPTTANAESGDDVGGPTSTDSGPGGNGVAPGGGSETTGAQPGATDAGTDTTAVGGEAAIVAETFAVTSRPEGATITIDGARLDGVTPLQVELIPGTDYRIGVALDGYESTGFEFTLDDLGDEQRANATLHFPLQPSTPPGRLAVRAPYAVSARVAGRTYDIPIGGTIQLQPGEYDVTFSAPAVFFSDTRRVRIASDDTATVALPPTTAVTIGATPSYCRVSIDGRDVGFVPVTMDIAVGDHEFVFDWERIGEQRTVRRAIRLDTDRVFVSATEGAGAASR